MYILSIFKMKELSKYLRDKNCMILENIIFFFLIWTIYQLYIYKSVYINYMSIYQLYKLEKRDIKDSPGGLFQHYCLSSEHVWISSYETSYEFFRRVIPFTLRIALRPQKCWRLRSSQSYFLSYTQLD